MKVKRECKNCGKIFLARQADVNRGWGLFCSKSCKAKLQELRTGQYIRYVNRKNSANDHPFGEDGVYYDDTMHPHDSESLGQWND